MYTEPPDDDSDVRASEKNGTTKKIAEVRQRRQDHQVRSDLAPLPTAAGYTGHPVSRR